MIRQYRIDRFNGVEMLVCECFRKHTWTQAENDAFFLWKEQEEKRRPNEVYLESDFCADFDDFLSSLKPGEDVKFFGLSERIPVFDTWPCIVLRGPIVDNRIAALQVDYVGSVLPVECIDEIRRFYGVMDSRHWRDTVSHQLESYGTLFSTDND